MRYNVSKYLDGHNHTDNQIRFFFYGATAQVGPRPPHYWGFQITHTPGRTSLNEWSARRRGHYLHNNQQTQGTNIHALSGVRTRHSCNKVAADLHLRPHSHGDPHWMRHNEIKYLDGCSQTDNRINIILGITIRRLSWVQLFVQLKQT
jgi:hypothetical protein